MDQLEITPNKITAINLAGAWLRVDRCRALSIAPAGSKAVAALEAFDKDHGEWLYVPVSQVYGYRTNGKVQTAEEQDEDRLAAAAVQEADFERHFRIDRKGYEKALAKQKGFCAECRVDLTAEPYCHWDDKRGLLCRQHSPYAHRY